MISMRAQMRDQFYDHGQRGFGIGRLGEEGIYL